jgi:hypothetical protein
MNIISSPIIKAFLIVLAIVMAIIMLSTPINIYGQTPKTQMQGEIAYITGGVGEEESAAIRGDAKNWPLMIDFSQNLENRDVWISQVDLRIQDIKGNSILVATTDGPLLLVRLQSGNYVLMATYEGVTKTQKMQIIDSNLLRVSLNWGPPKSSI